MLRAKRRVGKSEDRRTSAVLEVHWVRMHYYKQQGMDEQRASEAALDDIRKGILEDQINEMEKEIKRRRNRAKELNKMKGE